MLALVVCGACGSSSSDPSPAAGSATPHVTEPARDAAPVLQHRVETARATLPRLGTESIQRLIAQPDGRLLVVGDHSIARLGADLALDATFGKAGLVELSVRNAHSIQLSSAAIDAHGRIVVIGAAWFAGHNYDLVVARLSPDGKLDTRFGTAGLVVRDLTPGSESDDRPSDVFALPSGELAIVGVHSLGAPKQADHFDLSREYDGYLARLDDTGKLIGTIAFFDPIVHAREFVTRAMLDDGGFLLTGYAVAADPDVEPRPTSTAPTCAFVARIRADGTLDPAFGTAGVTCGTGVIADAEAWEIATARNGDILIAGTAGERTQTSRGFVARFDRHGKPIATWGDRGVALDGTDKPHVDIQWIPSVFDVRDAVLAVNRYDGKLIQFDVNGHYEGVVARGRGDSETYDVAAELPNGDIVVAGVGVVVRYARR